MLWKFCWTNCNKISRSYTTVTLSFVFDVCVKYSTYVWSPREQLTNMILASLMWIICSNNLTQRQLPQNKGPFMNSVTRDTGARRGVNFDWFSSVTRLKAHYWFLKTSVTTGGGRGGGKSWSKKGPVTRDGICERPIIILLYDTVTFVVVHWWNWTCAWV